MDRRNFLKASISTVSFSALPALAAPFCMSSCSEHRDIPIIDTHQHLWDLEMFPLLWVKPPMDQNYLMDDYISAIGGHKLVKAVYMEVSVPQELRKKEAEWARDLCRDPSNPTVAAVISADPSEPGFESYIRKFEADPYIAGIRYVPQLEGNAIPEPVLSNIQLLGRLGMSMDFNPSPEQLFTARTLLDSCPDTQFILDHCGGADPVAFFPEGKDLPREPKHDRDLWYRDMEELAKHPNLACKISGIVDNVGGYPLEADDLRLIIDHCLDVFGPDRVVFGGDWPICTRNMKLGRWIDLLKEIVIPRPYEEQRKLFHDNALKIYRLTRSSS